MVDELQSPTLNQFSVKYCVWQKNIVNVSPSCRITFVLEPDSTMTLVLWHPLLMKRAFWSDRLPRARLHCWRWKNTWRATLWHDCTSSAFQHKASTSFSHDQNSALVERGRARTTTSHSAGWKAKVVCGHEIIFCGSHWRVGRLLPVGFSTLTICDL